MPDSKLDRMLMSLHNKISGRYEAQLHIISVLFKLFLSGNQFITDDKALSATLWKYKAYDETVMLHLCQHVPDKTSKVRIHESDF